jgi:hypothetical protein
VHPPVCAKILTKKTGRLDFDDDLAVYPVRVVVAFVVVAPDPQIRLVVVTFLNAWTLFPATGTAIFVPSSSARWYVPLSSTLVTT